MKYVVAVLFTILLASPAFALDDEFASSSWDSSVWLRRTPLSGSAVRTGQASPDATDGFEAQLVYPKNRPSWEWGPRYASQIMSVEHTLYGDFVARLRSGGANNGAGVISAFFTYFNDEVDWDGDGIVDNHEIDIELPNSDPSGIFLSVYTDYQYVNDVESFNRVGARVDLATGEVWGTPPGGQGTWDFVQYPSLGFTVPGFDHRSRFYTYGFEWRYDRVTFWIDLEDGAGQRVLWEVVGSPDDDIPSLASPTFFNVWHNPVDWWSRANAPPPTRNAVLRVDHVAVGPPSAGCVTDDECDDGNPCNGFEVCFEGGCAPGAAADCSDPAGVCTTDSCVVVDSSTWECHNDLVSCDDGDACTVEFCDPASGCASVPVVCPTGEECSAGACVQVPMCLPHNTDCSSNEDCCSGRCRGGKRARCL